MEDEELLETIGSHIRTLRRKQGKSLAVVAGLAGISKSLLSQVENGRKPMNNRHMVAAVADALGVSFTDLTGQPYPSNRDRELAAIEFGLQKIGEVLARRTTDFTEGTTVRPLPILKSEVARIGKLRNDAKYADALRNLPGILEELHELFALGSDRESVAELLITGALADTTVIARTFGYHAVALLAADRERAIAEEMDSPLWLGYSSFARAQNLVALGAFRRAYTVSMSGANELDRRKLAGHALEVYGMLYLNAAFNLTSIGNPNDGLSHIDEANLIAQRTGETRTFRFWFGPTNVGIWRMALTVEAGNGGRVPEIADLINPRLIPAPDKRCDYYQELGRGITQTGKNDDKALFALRQAEDLAPQKVRSNPLVRDVITTMALRARRDAYSRDLFAMAHRMGIAV
jgi:transcriptional regulator with XRE-family HTH domain